MEHFTTMFYDDLNAVTENNTNFREVIATTPNLQLVVMSLQPLEEIGSEVHPYITQFIRVETGIGLAVINDVAYELYDGVAVIIPLGTKHNIINISETDPLKLYTIYSPPNHPMNRIDITKPIPGSCD
jgi:mannose-6-phosphate isomerase-like protein (cupin superfamily)